MFFGLGKKFAYHPIKSPPPLLGDMSSPQRIDKLRRNKSQSLFFLVFLLLVTYIVLNVFLPDTYTWSSLYSTEFNYNNYDSNSISGSGSSSSNFYVGNKHDDLVRSATTGIGIDLKSEYDANIVPKMTENIQDNLNESFTENSLDSSSLFSSSSFPIKVTEGSSTISTLSLDEKIACRIPKLDPYDSSIKHLIKKPSQVKVDCVGKFPLLFKSFHNSTLVPVTDKIIEKEYESCCYRTILRKLPTSKNPDAGYRKSEECFPVSIENNTIIKNTSHEFIAIYCSILSPTSSTESSTNLSTSSAESSTNSSTSSTNSSTDSSTSSSTSLESENETIEKIVDMHAFVHLKSPTEKRVKAYYKKLKRIRKTKKKPGNITVSSSNASSSEEENYETFLEESERLNVVILGIDAVSHMNFLRTMKKSYNYLMNNLSAVEMQGFNKIGDNTYPNMAAALTSYNKSQMTTCESSETFDACPFIWKEYASHGYRTSFGEDATWMGIFNYLKKGFHIPPTDYYFRQFGEAADDLIGTNKRINAKLCQGPRLSFQILLDYMEKLAYRMGHSKRYFQLIWATAMTHDYLNDAHLGDKYLYSMLKWFNNQGYLNHTMFILMSDHGIRWGDIHDFIQGEVEERLPFLYFIAPNWFKKKYSRAFNNLKNNVDRLTTPFDLHETLHDLLNLDSLNSEVMEIREGILEEMGNSDEGYPKGISQFLPIPVSRTCEDAAVEEHYCTCHKSAIVPNDDKVVGQVANYVVYSINFMISKYSGCAFLSLKRVIRALAISSQHDEWNAYQIVLETKPGGAVFDASVRKDLNGFWTISGTVSRTNLYGNQSHCVTKKEIKLYCFCVDMMKRK